MPKLSELLLTSQDTNPTSNDAIPTLKEVGGEATNKMAQLKDLPVSTAQAAADALKVNKAGDTMTGQLNAPSLGVGSGRLFISSTTPTSPVEGDLWVDLS